MAIKGLKMAVTLLAMLVAVPAQAQLVSANNPEQIAAIVRNEGLKAELSEPKDENPFIESASSGRKFLILFMNCDDNKRNCKTIQFYMGYNDAKDVSLERLNEWNRDKRFARAYRDNEGDPVLEMDLDLDFKGIPPENVSEALSTWLALMDAYHDHIHGR